MAWYDGMPSQPWYGRQQTLGMPGGPYGTNPFTGAGHALTPVGGTAGGGGHPLTPDPNPFDPNAGNPPPPPPPSQWLGGAHIFPTDTFGRSAYDLSPELAWSAAAHYLSPNTASPRYDYVTSHAQQFGNEFAAGQANGTTDRNMSLSQYIEQQAPTYMQRYDMQTPQQKGYSLGWQNSGRYTG